MLFKILFISILQISLFGNDIVDLFKFSFHGEFCGMDTPSIKKKSKSLEIKELESMKPLDTIDNACKEHDICYLKRGFNDKSCDSELIAAVKKIENNMDENDCKMLTKSIVLFFETKNDNFVTELSESGSVDKKIINASSTGAENMFDLATYSGKLAINYGFSRPMEYILDSKNNKDRLKDFLQVFPPRHKKCIEKN